MNPVLGFVGLATLNMNNYLPTQFKPYLCLTSVSFRGTILLLVSNDIIKNLNQELAQKIFTLCKELAVSNVIQKFHVDKLTERCRSHGHSHVVYGMGQEVLFWKLKNLN